MGGWMWEGDVFLLSSSGGIPLDTVTTLLKKLKFFEFVGLLSTSEFPKTFSRQDGWHILRTEQRDKAALRRQTHFCCLWFFSAAAFRWAGLFYAGSAARARLSHSW